MYNVYIYIYIHTYIHIYTPEVTNMKNATKATMATMAEICHLLRCKMPLKVHGTIAVKIHWESDSPLERVTEKSRLRCARFANEDPAKSRLESERVLNVEGACS